MRIKQLNILLALFVTINGYSQNWQSLDGGANSDILGIYGDTTNHILYVAGYFTTIGGIPANNIAKWNGTHWDSLGNSIYPFNFGRHPFTMYKNKIVCATNMFSYTKQHIVAWNGTAWDSIGSNFTTGLFEGAITLNKELYAFGTFDYIGATNYNGIAKFDTITNTWVSVGFPYVMPSSPPTIKCLQIYHGELYAGGLFLDSIGGVTANIAKFNGSSWSIVGQGITGSIDEVFALEVYQNELYAAGQFTEADGNPGNNIARWNDTVWKDVGGGVTSYGQINALLVLNNKLYAGGVFDSIGGISAPYIASWDGTNWCGFGNSIFSSGTSALATINDSLYINCSNIWDADTLNYIAQWIGGNYVDTCGHLTTGINEIASDNTTLNIYPNPTTYQITFEFELNETKNASIEIKNVLGQTVKTITNSTFTKGINKIDINVSELSSGIYFAQLQIANKINCKKIIKQ